MRMRKSKGPYVRRRPWLVVASAASLAAAVAVAGATAGSEATSAGPAYKLAGKFGKVGTGNGQISSNTLGIATDNAGNVYVADTDNARVQVFSAGAIAASLAQELNRLVSRDGKQPGGGLRTPLEGARTVPDREEHLCGHVFR